MTKLKTLPLACVLSMSALLVPHGNAAENTSIRPFRVDVPQAQLMDLKARIAATRWPGRETVTDQSRGVQLAKIQQLVRYWGTEYNWRTVEAKLNALP